MTNEEGGPVVLRPQGLSLSAEELAIAAGALRSGRLAAFPTDTVYGVGTNAASPSAVRRLFQAKRRPRDMALPVLLADVEDLPVCARDVPDMAQALAERFWPGALSIILLRTDAVCPEAAGGGRSIALRLPAHEMARQIVRAAGVPVAVTSANPSGAASTTEAAEVARTLGPWLDAVVQGGPCGSGVASTVIDMTLSPPRVLRWGGVGREQLEAVIGRVQDAAE